MLWLHSRPAKLTVDLGCVFLYIKAMNKEHIIKLLETNDKAVIRALVVLNARQTPNEQSSQMTVQNNGRGFTPYHAFMGTSMANFYAKTGFLTDKQIAYWRKPNAKGRMKIAMYWKQLKDEADQKALSKVAP